jgi:hypothetical protein
MHHSVMELPPYLHWCCHFSEYLEDLAETLLLWQFVSVHSL